MEKKKDEWSVYNLISGLIRPINLVMMHVLRLFGLVYQMWFQEVRDGCLSWSSDTMELTRTPFAVTCWREIDWFIAGTYGAAWIMALCFLFRNLIEFVLLQKAMHAQTGNAFEQIKKLHKLQLTQIY